MTRRGIVFFLLCPLYACCALQGTVQRQSVEYNTAVAGMANQLTLLNIVRAANGVPTYYTTISRLTGTITVKATAGFNAQIRAPQPTVTSSNTSQSATSNVDAITNSNGTTGLTTTTPSAAMGTTLTTVASSTPSTTTAIANSNGTMVATAAGTLGAYSNATTNGVANTLTGLISNVVASGGNIYTPSATGEIDSGPQFDINILDTQEFYQGILSGVSFPVVEDYVNQDVDNQLLLRLLVLRINFKYKPVRGQEDMPKFAGRKAGDLVFSLKNAAGDDQDNDDASRFARQISCYKIEGIDKKILAKPLAPLSRLTRGDAGENYRLKMQDLALLDDQKLGLTGAITDDPTKDRLIAVTKPETTKRVAELKLRKSCAAPLKISDDPETAPVLQDLSFAQPPPDPVYLGGDEVLLMADDKKSDIRVPVEMEVIFRSPEGIIQFLGRYLKSAKEHPDKTYRLGKQPLFSVKEGSSSHSAVNAELFGKRYYIAVDENFGRNMTTIGLVEQLVNLQKSAKDRPTTLPVEVLP